LSKGRPTSGGVSARGASRAVLKKKPPGKGKKVSDEKIGSRGEGKKKKGKKILGRRGGGENPLTPQGVIVPVGGYGGGRKGKKRCKT